MAALSKTAPNFKSPSPLALAQIEFPHTYPLADVGERPPEQDEEVEGLVHEALPALLQDSLKGLAMEPLIGVIPLLDGQKVVQGQALRRRGE